MLRRIYSLTFIIAILYGKTFAANVPSEQFLLHDIFGEPKNDIQPKVEIEKSGADWNDWSITIDYLAQTNFSGVAWLMITNRVGSKPQLWLTNEMELQSTNPNVLAAINLPSQTTVSNIMRGVRSQWRPGQWLRRSQAGLSSGDDIWATTFSLQSAFNVPFTNDYVLQITPLLYKVETNRETAHLIEFPPIKVKLMANGDVQKIQ